MRTSSRTAPLLFSSLAVLVSTTATSHLSSGLALRDLSCAIGDNLNLRPCLTRPFCCQSGTSCIEPIAAPNTVLCCPNGQDCARIQPIACNINLQDESQYPNATVHSSDLSVTLPTCGTACCPSGYSCVNRQCVLLLNSDISSMALSSSPTMMSGTSTSTNSARSSASIATSAVVATTVSAISPFASQPIAITSTASSTTPKGAATNAPITTTSKGKSYVGTIAGVVVGLLIGSLAVAALVFVLLRRQRDRKERKARDTNIWYQKTPPQTVSPVSGPIGGLPFRTARQPHIVAKPDNGAAIGSHEPLTKIPEPHQWMARQGQERSPYINLATPSDTPERPPRSGVHTSPRRATTARVGSLRGTKPHDSYIRTNSDSSLDSMNRTSRSDFIQVSFTPPPPTPSLTSSQRIVNDVKYASNMTTFSGLMESAGLGRSPDRWGRDARY